MPHGDGDAPAREPLHELESAVQLRGERHHRDRTRFAEPVRQLRVRLEQIRGIVCPRPLPRQKWALEVHAKHPGSAVARGHRGRRGSQRGVVRLRRGGHRRRLVGHRANRGERLGGACMAVHVSGEEVDAGDPVDVGVHEPGHRDTTAAMAGHADRRHRIAVDSHVAVDERSVDERGAHPEPHAYLPGLDQHHYCWGRAPAGTGGDTEGFGQGRGKPAQRR